MALKPCPACGHTVSTEAAQCPQCGHPIRGAAGGTGIWGTVARVTGAWLIAPWVARALAFVAACVVAAVALLSR